ncbi:ankyrin repeat protein [Hypoxylon rubiginosum]|uniref:Ankyrin repeat protein n=1 Tax=Hypoxylon rubiginosum TaxID=110542 RepID=A0ACC0CIQ3_9PEZI|nr:ankyrin repeat protein [Hypoxylon rubiginosum]
MPSLVQPEKVLGRMINRSLPTLPLPPSQFISYFAENPEVPIRQLLEPYLTYETWLRLEFAKNPSQADGFENLVSIYDGQEDKLKIRAIDRQTADRNKYILPLSKREREKDGSLAITSSLLDYRDNFKGFTRNWSNIVVAGSAALLPLLSRRRDIKIDNDPATESPSESYYQTTAAWSDVDIFLYGIDDEASAIKRIIEIDTVLRKNQHFIYPDTAMSLRSDNAITFVSPRWPFRHIQVILRLYRSINEILTGFDVDCACVAFDGEQVYSNPRGIAAIVTRTNTIDISRRSPSYENRLWKYRSHKFEVYWDYLDRSRLRRISPKDGDNPKTLTGLARLIHYENTLRGKYTEDYKRIDDGGDPTLVASSGYAALEIPYGRDFTAGKARRYFETATDEPYRCGTILEVTGQCPHSKEGKGKLRKKMAFVKDNPGRQMIGSFYPLNEEDW